MNVLDFEFFAADLPAVMGAWQAHVAGQCGGHLFHTGDQALHCRLLQAPDRLVGWLHYGACVDDEWLVTRLLVAFSRQHAAVHIRAADRDDGEYLLIEAADHLPDWAEPDVMACRVYIHCGDIVWLEPPSTPSDLARPMPLPRAHTSADGPALPCSLDQLPALLQRLKRAPDSVQSAVQARLDRCAAAAQSQRHRVVCCLPADVAALLRCRPGCVGAAVDALQDELSGPAAAAALLSLTPRRTACTQPPWTVASVTLSRTMFAVLSSFQHLQWPPVLQRLLTDTADDPTTRRRYELGAKIVCGFELLLDPARNPDTATSLATSLAASQQQLEEEEEEEEELVEDSEEWMHVTPDEVDDLLARYSFTNAGAPAEATSQIFDDLSAFLRHPSDVCSGAEAPADRLRPVKLNVDRFLSILAGADSSYRHIVAEMDAELRAKAHGLDTDDHDAVLVHLLDSILAQRTSGATTSSPAEPFIRLSTQR